MLRDVRHARYSGTVALHDGQPELLVDAPRRHLVVDPSWHRHTTAGVRIEGKSNQVLSH